MTATGPRLWAGLNALDQRLGTGATERYFSCWLAAAIYVKIGEELEALFDMADRYEATDVDHNFLTRKVGSRAETAHIASPDSATASAATAKARDRAVFIEICSTSRRMVSWHSHAATASRDRSTSIWPRRSDLIAPDARSFCIRSVTVVRRTPSICDSAS